MGERVRKLDLWRFFPEKIFTGRQRFLKLLPATRRRGM